MGGIEMSAYLFKNAIVWDGIEDAPFPGEVLVEGNRITKVARGRQTIIPGWQRPRKPPKT
jgi:hypothetical protein